MMETEVWVTKQKEREDNLELLHSEERVVPFEWYDDDDHPSPPSRSLLLLQLSKDCQTVMHTNDDGYEKEGGRRDRKGRRRMRSGRRSRW